eukprot:TRINITY_DN9976_c0_g1_i1.p1 TRINITY_DN9976_c0_g1~~TRINITY_DN9976_c0_g1_i1.p1  ORF type:complete len:537 (+),score=79.02 TRINITY_DN9976_c0_g1_i1:225-1835(+)
MPQTDLLKKFGLSRNPFTDRIAEKTSLDDLSLYLHSDLQGFEPNETTYIFFGRRGSGKTTIRLKMMNAYDAYNAQQLEKGEQRGHFLVDICSPIHMSTCLRTFQENIGASMDNWDSAFDDNWTSADMVDCILSYVMTRLVEMLCNKKRPVTIKKSDSKILSNLEPSYEERHEMMERLYEDEKMAGQFLVMAHLYAQTDVASLTYLRRRLLKERLSLKGVAIGVGAAAVTTVGIGAILSTDYMQDNLLEPVRKSWRDVTDPVPWVREHPRVVLTPILLGTTFSTVRTYYKLMKKWSEKRAMQLQGTIRVAARQPAGDIGLLLDSLFNRKDNYETIRTMMIGVSAHQKLQKLLSLVQLLGYESIAIFGDCFDEVNYLDPVIYPGAIKAFAREICRNDLLMFGRLHFFFPDSRLALDLNTDKTLKEARFDRHFVRDLDWSRHQLEELAERRFQAAQQKCLVDSENSTDVVANNTPASFNELFKEISGEDFSSYVSKLRTPRELMIMMTELFSRLEQNPGKSLSAQDLEISVNKAQQQTV